MRVTIRVIAELVALETGVPLDSIFVRTDRSRATAHARQLTCWLARRSASAEAMQRRSSPLIGKVLGLDHATVLYAVRRVELRIRSLPWWGEHAPRMLAIVKDLERGAAGGTALMDALAAEIPELRRRRFAIFSAASIKASPNKLCTERPYPAAPERGAVITCANDQTR